MQYMFNNTCLIINNCAWMTDVYNAVVRDDKIFEFGAGWSMSTRGRDG